LSTNGDPSTLGDMILRFVLPTARSTESLNSMIFDILDSIDSV